MIDDRTDGSSPDLSGSPSADVQQDGSGIPPEEPGDFQEPKIPGTQSAAGDISRAEDFKDPEEDDGTDQEPPPEDDRPPVTFNQEKQEADTIYNVGIMTAPTDKPLFEKIPSTVISQVEKLFLPPPLFSKARLSGRIIVVSGPAHSGKFFCSVKLATILRESQPLKAADSTGSIFLYSRLRHETAPLQQSLAWVKKGSVLILEDVFGKNVSERELGSNELTRLDAVLAARQSFLILTTDVERLKTTAPIVSTQNLDLKKMFEKYRLFYFPADKTADKAVAGLIRNHKDNLAGLFTSPFQIEHFFQKLRTRPPVSEKEIQELAHEAAQAGREDLRGWFDALPNHVKMMGLLACLLEGIEKVTMEGLFVESVGKLRAQGFGWITDLRELGLREAWPLLRVTLDGSHVHFEQKSIREELEWQVENRHLLLWSVMQPIAAEAADKAFWREDVRARALLAAAVGWLGVWDEGRFCATLEGWAHARNYLAQEPDNGMGSLPGYALVETLLSDPLQGRSRVLKVLADWIASREPDLMWAAGAAIWRLYQTATSMTMLEISVEAQAGLSRDLIAQLHSLVANSLSLTKATRAKIRSNVEAQVQRSRQNTEPPNDNLAVLSRERESEVKRQLWNCATFALKRIGEVDTQQLNSTIARWFGEESQIFGWVASRAAQFTFLDLATRKEKPDTLDEALRLELVDVVLAQKSTESRVVEWMFDWLDAWLPWPAWKSRIEHHLLSIANRGPHSLRCALRAALARYWTVPVPEKEIEIPQALMYRSLIARALIARSYAMAGVLADLPALGHCFLIVDPELIQGRAPRKALDRAAQQQAERREGAILQILAMVEARMKVTVILLGAQEASTSDNGGLRLTSDLPLHRLMRPGVQNVAPDGVRMILLLTAGPVIDLEDGLDSVSAEHKLVIAANCELEVPLGTELLRVGRDLSARDLETVESKLRLICARAQAALDPAGWEPLLERLGVSVADLDAAPEATLAAWAAQLDKFPGDTTGHDPAKKILCAFLRLAAADLDACLRIVRTWLTDGTDLKRSMAAAIAVALLRAVTDAPGIWGGLAPQRTFDELAGPLAGSGKDGTYAMLETVKRWLAEPTLAEVLAGVVEDGRCRLLRWAEEAAPQQVEAFQEALKPLRKSLEDAELGPSGEVLDAVFNRLRVRLAMGRPRPLPALAAGETFGLIVIDASARWGQLAADLFSRFNEPPTSLKPLLYRLGERWPSWVAGDPNPKPADLSPVGVRLPRLIGPILNELSPAAVSFLVVLSGEMWIDGEDWIDSPWRERIFTFRQLPDAPFRPVLAAFPHRPDQKNEEVDLMELVLKKQPMRGAEEAA